MVISLEHPASRLEFDGLTLRPMAFPDIPGLLEAVRESQQELGRFLLHGHNPQLEELHVERFRSLRFALGVFRGERFLASCGLMPERCPLNPKGAEVGWWVRTSEAGQGLATLTCRVAALYGFAGLGLDRLQVAHNPDNAASARVIAKCGFVLEGLTRNSVEAFDYPGLSKNRDLLTYSLLPHEARALPWFAQLAPRIRVFDLLGNDLGQPWS